MTPRASPEPDAEKARPAPLMPLPKLRFRTAWRLAAAFAAVLAVFAAAMVTTLLTLRQISRSTQEVASLDYAKHSGHYAAALVREQYIQQARAIITNDATEATRYEAAAAAARDAVERLSTVAESEEECALAERIATLARESDATFRDRALPAIQQGDTEAVRSLHEELEAGASTVVALNDELNKIFERRSEQARAHADDSRRRARVIVITFFGLATLLSAIVGFLIVRSIARPIAALRAGTDRIGAGDLGVRITSSDPGEFGQLATAFNQMTADLLQHQANLLRAERLASIGQVAAGVAHEINNPLGVILGYAKLMQRDAPFANRDELKIIEDEARQCQRIVESLLELARSPRLVRTDVDVVELAREALERLEEAGKLDGIEVRAPSTSVPLISGDDARVRQAVWNTVLNAAEATPTGGEVTVDGIVNEKEAGLVVSDTGAGLSAEVLAQAFDPFFTTKPDGTGLGLPIVQSIVEAHSGRIDIQSEPGKGTSVALWFPVS